MTASLTFMIKKNKKLGATYSSETFDQRWSAISTCVARTRAGVTARVLSQAPTPHCTKLCRCGTLWDIVWQCVTVCDTVQRQSSAFFRGKLTTLVLPLLLTTSRQLVNKRWTGIFSTCLNCASIFRDRGHEMFHDDMIMYAIINDQQSVIAMITRSSPWSNLWILWTNGNSCIYEWNFQKFVHICMNSHLFIKFINLIMEMI